MSVLPEGEPLWRDPFTLEQIAQWLEQRGLRIPVSQVVGYQNDRQATSVQKSTQSITSGSQTNITFDTVLYDATKLYPGSGGDVTVKVPGVYLMVASVQWASQTGGLRILIPKKNTVAQLQPKAEATAGNNAPEQSVALQLRMAVGDIFRLDVFQDSGSAVNAIGATLSVALINRFI